MAVSSRTAPSSTRANARSARQGTVHLVGLIGKGGVHAIDQHLFALIELCARERVPRVAIHAMLDGRDTMPRSGLGYMRELLERAAGKADVASVGGRYYGMDRDKRWDRTEKWYRVAVQGVGPRRRDPLAVIRASYEHDVTDEFVVPTVISNDGRPVAPMRDGDVVICFNYRADRMRQIVRSLTEPDFDGFDVSERPSLSVVTMTSYDRTFDVPVAFPPQSMKNIVAEVVSNAGHDHVQDGGDGEVRARDVLLQRRRRGALSEARIACSSRVRRSRPTILCPEMSAFGITDVLCDSIEKNEHDFTLCNYANGDMVGHTGSIPATIKAVETVDRCLDACREVSAKGRRARAGDGGSRQLRDDDRSGDRRSAHRTHDQSRSVHRHRSGRRSARCAAVALCVTSARRCCACSDSSSPAR